MNSKKMSLAQLKQQLLSEQIEAQDNQILIRIVDYIEEQKRSSKTGQSYTQITVKYDWVDRPVIVNAENNTCKYLTVGFTESGRAVRQAVLQMGDVYRVTTAVNDRDYDEWVKLEQLFIDD